MKEGAHFMVPDLPPLSPDETEKRRKEEEALYLAMAELYCKKKGHDGRTEVFEKDGTPLRYRGKPLLLCENCARMALRAVRQTRHCPHMAYKTFCHECPRPCHKPDPEIRDMMRFSGPRVLLRHPLMYFRFLKFLLRSKKHQASLRKDTP